MAILQTKPKRMTPRARKSWSELNAAQRSTIMAGAAVQLALLTAAQVDLARRPVNQIRGSKLMWRLVVFINFIGPLAYLAFGRKGAPRRASRQPVVVKTVSGESRWKPLCRA